MGGQATHLPLRVNSGGVMPVIFASSLLSIPQFLTLSNAFKPGGTLNRYFGGVLEQLKWGEPLYTLLYAVGIIFFAYFYVSIVFNPSDVADNARKYIIDVFPESVPAIARGTTSMMYLRALPWLAVCT